MKETVKRIQELVKANGTVSISTTYGAYWVKHNIQKFPKEMSEQLIREIYASGLKVETVLQQKDLFHISAA